MELVAVALGVTPRGHPLAEVSAFLGAAPGVLALDNLETPWEGDREATDVVLGALAQIPGLVLVASVRGVERPAGVAWGETLSVEPLPDEPAADLFCDIARSRRDDPALAALLVRLEGVPLAITLLAHAAEGASLAGLVQEWEAQHTTLLRREGVKEGRETSWAASMALSVRSPRMTEEARRLLGLLGRLPDGVAFADLEELLPGKGHVAKRKLVQMGLAYEEEERLRVLAPVREYAGEAVVPAAADMARAMEHYGALARTLGPKAGNEGGAEAIARLAPETANLDAMIREGLKGSAAARWIDVAGVLTNFARFSGRSSPSPLGAARDVARALGSVLEEAHCIRRLGAIALSRSDHEEARRRYDEALPLYRRGGAVLGEANCIYSLGDVALSRSDHEEARRRYDEALLLYRRVGDVLGETNCIRSLGDIALRRSDHEEARRRYEEALPLYRRVRSAVGEANCIKGLGTIALQRSDLEEARHRYDEALPLYRRVGDVVGEAHCIESLGDIALERSDDEEARRRYDEALLLYRRVGSVHGEANCILSLGDIARDRSDPATARVRYTQALSLFARIPEPFSMGWAHRRLARVAADPAEKQHHLDTARALWTKIDRPDLVAMIDRELAPTR